jgi:GMP synthase (glutamine-hydrolysing)
MTEQIVILDFGSQYTQVIARRIRELSVYSTILPYNTPASEIAEMQPMGILLSGGPASVYSPKAPLPDPAIFELGIPIMGICFGLQTIGKLLGGSVEKCSKREFGKSKLEVLDKTSRLFTKLPKNLQVWNSHGDQITKLPPGFKAIAKTENLDLLRSRIARRKFSVCSSILKWLIRLVEKRF